MTGATNNAGTADEVQWWEDGRLHKTVSISAGGIDTSSGATGHFSVTSISSSTDEVGAGCRINDVLLTPGGQRLIVTGLDDSDNEVDFTTLDGSNVVAEDSATTLAIIGNIYAQGTDQPNAFTSLLSESSPTLTSSLKRHTLLMVHKPLTSDG